MCDLVSVWIAIQHTWRENNYYLDINTCENIVRNSKAFLLEKFPPKFVEFVERDISNHWYDRM